MSPTRPWPDWCQHGLTRVLFRLTITPPARSAGGFDGRRRWSSRNRCREPVTFSDRCLVPQAARTLGHQILAREEVKVHMRVRRDALVDHFVAGHGVMTTRTGTSSIHQSRSYARRKQSRERGLRHTARLLHYFRRDQAPGVATTRHRLRMAPSGASSVYHFPIFDARSTNRLADFHRALKH